MDQKIDATSTNLKESRDFSSSDHLIEVSLKALKFSSSPDTLTLIFTNSSEQQDLFYAALQSLMPDDISLHVWSSWEHSPFSTASSSLIQKIDRLKTLNSIKKNSGKTIILCTPESWVQPTAPPEEWIPFEFTLSVHQDVQSLDEIREKLTSLGYLKSEQVEEPGQFSIRGEIIDLFIPTEDFPHRIELFDTVVEKIRHFNPETQRTLKHEESNQNPISLIHISPAEEVLYQRSNLPVFLEKIKEDCDARSISRKIRDPVFETIKAGFFPEYFRVWIPYFYKRSGYLLDYLAQTSKKISVIQENADLFKIQIRQFLAKKGDEEALQKETHRIIPVFHSLYSIDESSFEKFICENPTPTTQVFFDKPIQKKIGSNELEDWISEGYEILIGTPGISSREHLNYLLKEQGFERSLSFCDFDPGASYLIQDLNGKKTALLSPSIITGVKTKSAPQRKSTRNSNRNRFNENTASLTHINDLSPGDTVVHTLHGVGKFIGLEKLKTRETQEVEYLLIEYSGKDKLYLPVYRLNSIQKYIGAGSAPSLDKLGSGEFEKAKQKARDSARKIAINLVELYAKRSLIKGPRMIPPGEDYFNFCEHFEFEETDDQLKAIHETLQDLQSGKLLDRLVCGDVGFGKTEVAIRAAFQAVQSGFQVAVLVPTTLLAFQHEQTFKKRMATIPVQIDSLSRFKSKKTQLKIIEDLKNGKVDVVIGTHRLLSKDVTFNKLGLLIIDEEHRFGVEHKEKIKVLQTNTHTLTLTATPIPRTLNMALAGMKEMSLIQTPPQNRQPIKTFIGESSPELIRDAIENELSRGGQVFILSNRVQGMDHLTREIQNLVPHAKVSFAHGKMSEDEIEKRMLEFYQGYVQVLICTTIIESGIDVPNAGTILIENADRLGLAQLYQIRGRVGRSHRKAFAYLLISREKVLSREAKMRLEVLQRFVELGSGYQIATHDLEIRGGGNLIGPEQSGNIAEVGMDLFLEMIEEAVQELKGKPIDIEERHFEPEIQIPVKCEISSDYVEDPKTRLSLYRRISSLRSREALESFQQEMVERFGTPPPEVIHLLGLIRIRNLIKKMGVESLICKKEKTVLTVKKQSPISSDEVMKLYVGPKGIRDPRVTITPDSKIVLNVNFTTLQGHLYELQELFRKIVPKYIEIEETFD